MAITPSQWSHVLTIPESYTPSAATSGQTLVITESVIAKLSASDQSTFWSNVQNGGGDVRICTDAGGVNQLPVEIVSLDNVAETCVIWTRKPTYNGTGDLYVFIGKAGETQPLATDPFGRNAVWVDEAVSFTGDSLVDSTGNTTPTNNGATQITGPVGGAYSFDGVSNVIDFGDITSVDGSNTLAIAAWINPGTLTGDKAFAAKWNATSRAILFGTDNSDPSEIRFAVNSDPDGTGLFIEDSTTANLIASNWQRVYAIFDASTGCTIYKNGAPVSSTQLTNNFSGGILNTSDSLSIGGRSASSGNNFDGGIAGFILSDNSSGKYTSSYIATEYANQSDPATFFGTPTLSTTVTPTVDADVNYTINAPIFTASADASLPQPSADASFTISETSFSANGSATLPQPIIDVSFVVNSPSFTANATASLPQPIGDIAFTVNAPTFNADASATIPGFSASVGFDINAPTFSASANVTLPQPTADIDYSIAAPTFNASATASLPQPIAGVNYTVQAPLFSVNASATLTGYVADVNYTVPAPTFAASAEATLPQPTVDVGFTVSAPTFSVVAIVGGIAIIVDDETNINLPALSNNVTLPALSNNIDL